MDYAPEIIAARLLEVMEKDVLPLTHKGVNSGAKVFGAALLKKSDLSLVIAGTNNEIENPLWHGEVHTLKQFYERPGEKNTKDLIFFSTHEPCTMCMSAITWAGFDNYYYFYSHEDSRDAFAIPHDLKIMKELYGLDAGGYHRQNAFWKSFYLGDLVAASPEMERKVLEEQTVRIKTEYDRLSNVYQSSKSDNAIPLN